MTAGFLRRFLPPAFEHRNGVQARSLDPPHVAVTLAGTETRGAVAETLVESGRAGLAKIT